MDVAGQKLDVLPRRLPQGGHGLARGAKRIFVRGELEDVARREAQLALIRAHPELAGKAMVSKTLTAESTHEQGRAGLADCTPEEFARIQQLNADYNARFGWPFILAVRGPRGTGLSRHQIIETFARRLDGDADFEFAECLRNIHRIAELRLNDKFGCTPELGNLVWDWAERLSVHSDPGYAERGELTVTYLTAAHRSCARRIQGWMQEAGFDETRIDAVGNVVGVYHGADPGAQRLITGSHYDTVRNGGKYDGVLGILVPIACVAQLHRRGERLSCAIEVVAFADEEGHFDVGFLGSRSIIGELTDAEIDRVLQIINIDEPQSRGVCGCCGHPTFEFYAEDELVMERKFNVAEMKAQKTE